MKNPLINIIPELHTVDYITEYTDGGKFRFITKTKAGWMTTSDLRDKENEFYIKNLNGLLTRFVEGALQTIQFCPEGGDYYLTVFAKVGKKVKLIDEAILRDIEVATINEYFSKTNLMNQDQYRMVNAKTWVDKAFVMNEYTEVTSS
jgi:hypothetical protein